MLTPFFPLMILIHLDPLFKWYFDYDFDFTKNEPTTTLKRFELLKPTQQTFRNSCLDCSVGLSDLLLFSIFENVHIAAHQVYFVELNFLKNLYFALQVSRFSFSKITESLTINILYFFI